MFISLRQRVLQYRNERKYFLLAQRRGQPVYESYFFYGKQQYFYISISFLLILFLAVFFYRSFPAVLPLTPIGLKYYFILEKEKGKKRRNCLETEFKDCILSIAANLRAGYAVENAFVEAIPDMAALYGENGLMCRELYRFKKGLGNNRSLEEMLTGLGERSGCESIREFGEVFGVAVQNGGELPEIIQETADMIGEKIALKQEIEVLISGRLFEQRIMSAIPFFIVCYVEWGNRGFFDVLYHNLTGIFIMTVCMVVYLAAQLLSRRICNAVG